MTSKINLRGLKKNVAYASLATAILFLASGCSQPESFIKNKVDNFNVDTIDQYTQASSLIQADYLISVDFSWSMSGGCTNNSNCPDSKTQKLFDSLDTFTNNLVAEGIDYRIGLVQGSKQSTSNQAPTDFISGLVIDSAFESSLSELVRSRLGAVGKPLEGNVTSVVESASTVLARQKERFVRDSAQLVFLFVTDNDDRQYTQSQVNQLMALKNDSSYISARSVLAGVGQNCFTDGYEPINTYDNSYGENYGSRVTTATGLLDSSTSSTQACILGNFSTIMQNVARTISRQTKRFKLQVPNPDVSSLKVYINDALANSSDYNFVPSTNEIVFTDGNEPAPSAQLRIEYEQNYVLSTVPSLDSLEVLVNGSLVPQSTSNGWSYDSALNRILFHGSAKPSNGSKVQVIYKNNNV